MSLLRTLVKFLIRIHESSYCKKEVVVLTSVCGHHNLYSKDMWNMIYSMR